MRMRAPDHHRIGLPRQRYVVGKASLARNEPHVLDARRCISYLTIELRDQPIPREMREGIGQWLFGCDICQDVCPWTKFSRPAPDARFLAREGVPAPSLDEWAEIDLESFRERFRRSPFKRAKLDGLLRNVANARGHNESLE